MHLVENLFHSSDQLIENQITMIFLSYLLFFFVVMAIQAKKKRSKLKKQNKLKKKVTSKPRYSVDYW